MMQHQHNVRFRFLAAVVAAAAFYILGGPSVEAARLPNPLCEGFCDEARACDAACEVPVGEIWQVTTCGEYDGGWLNGHCAGDTCPLDCNIGTACSVECWDEGSPSDCGTYGLCADCGDTICAVGAGEDQTTCVADCGYCGDGVCQIYFELGGSNHCTADCGDVTPFEDECNPAAQDCGSEDVCNGRGICEPISTCNQTGLCYQDSDCCTNLGELCFIFPEPNFANIGFCGIGSYPDASSSSRPGAPIAETLAACVVTR